MQRKAKMHAANRKNERSRTTPGTRKQKKEVIRKPILKSKKTHSAGKRGSKENRRSQAKTGANGNGILKVCFWRRNDNFNVEFDRACVRSFYDGATFSDVIKDTPQYALTFQSSSIMGRVF